MTNLLCFAQDLAYNGDPDKSFFIARDLAFGGQRSVARDTLKHVLTKYPDYADVRNLLASTLSWDKKYDEARKHFNRITSAERKNKEAWVAAVKNELYAENYHIALGLTNKALLYLEKDSDLETLRSRALKDINTIDKKKDLKEKSVVIDTLEKQVLKNKIEISNSFDIFDVVYDPMVYSSLSYTRETQAGKIIPRINYSNRFETKGLQYELDFYPKFSETFYGYLNYGFSNASIYPDHRVGAELYANLPKSLEASAGFRFLDFGTTKATIYTGSIGMYRGNYYFSLRPYITPRDSGASFSGSLLARKYFKDGDNYLGINAGMGYSPELRQLRNDDQLLAETLLYIESQRISLQYQFTGKKNPNIYRADLGVTRQELIFDSGNYFWAVSAGITYQIKF